MRNRVLVFALLSFLLLVGGLPAVSAHKAPFPYGYYPTRLDIDTVGDPESMDPAWAYDTASEEVIMNVYETLIFFRVDWAQGPYAGVYPGKTGAGRTTEFVPRLATALPTIDYSSNEINPLTGSPYYSTWYFRISEGVYFHNGFTLTPADVEYSFERGMIQDRDGGPQWMLFEALLGEYFADSGPDGGV